MNVTSRQHQLNIMECWSIIDNVREVFDIVESWGEHTEEDVECLRLYLDDIGEVVGVRAAKVLDTFQRLDAAAAPVVAGNLIAMAERLRASQTPSGAV